MRNYDRINALPPERINDKRAHIIGGGMAGLAAAGRRSSTGTTRARDADEANRRWAQGDRPVGATTWW